MGLDPLQVDLVAGVLLQWPVPGGRRLAVGQVVSTGLLVLPEPIVVVNRTGSLSDTRAFGWQFITQHQILLTA